MDKDLENELENAKKEPKKKIKWICPICDGDNLKKQKVIVESDNTFISVTEELGELIITITNENNEIIKQSKFPIKYCPWCGRKIREKYRKLEK